MNENTEKRKWRVREKVFLIVLSSIVSIAGFFAVRLYAQVDGKLDKEVYYSDMVKLDKKLDMYDVLQKERSDAIMKTLDTHEENSRVRFRGKP